MKKSTPTESISIPENFASIISDFSKDLSLTFPEYEHLWERWNIAENIPTSMIKNIYYHCIDMYPERFFDILYQNDEIFQLDNNTNTFFLPNVDFKLLFNCPNVSESTKNTMWKYIQLVLFTIIGNIRDKSDFGKSMNLFEGMDEEELQSKLMEAMQNMTDFFKKVSTDTNNPHSQSQSKSEYESNKANGFPFDFNSEGMEKNMNDMFEKMNEEFEKAQTQEEGTEGENKREMPKMPNPEDIHNHLKGLFDGKLGILAKELMEELSEELKDTFGMEDMHNANGNPKEIFSKLMKNPDKFMKIVKKIHERFQDKIKKGDISQDEIMKEAGDMLKKLKEMGGNSKEMNDMFRNMAKSMGQTVNKNTKVDVNAMNRMVKSQDIKDRLRAKLAQKQEMANNPPNFELQSIDKDNLVYRPLNSEKPEKSMFPPTISAPKKTKEEEAAELDKLVADIEGTGSKSKPETTNNKKKGKANKKK